MQFGTNHLGHFAFTGLLLDRLLPVAGSRVVTISSIGHRIRADIHFDDLQWEHSYNRVAAYGQAKLANLLFTYELQRRLAPHGTTIAAAAHPGGSHTELVAQPACDGLRPFTPWSNRYVAQDATMGALPHLRAATDPAVLGGQYFGPDGLGQTRGYPKSRGVQRQSRTTPSGSAAVGRVRRADRRDLSRRLTPELRAGRATARRNRRCGGPDRSDGFPESNGRRDRWDPCVASACPNRA